MVEAGGEASGLGLELESGSELGLALKLEFGSVMGLRLGLEPGLRLILGPDMFWARICCGDAR